MFKVTRPRLGSTTDQSKDGVHFCVWAPLAKKVEVEWRAAGASPQYIPMRPDELGYHQASIPGAKVGDLYKYRLDGKESYPDPASKYQPNGPHEASQVVAEDFPWADQSWKGVPTQQLTIYEIHVGTFTPEGTFQGVEAKLEHLQSLGVNAIEIMPVAQFAGNRNWGYDGVGLFAAHNTYAVGEPAALALKRLVNRCHQMGLAVILDVVYNHIGPEGNYLPKFGPYFQSKYKTPWGNALNYDGEWSDEVRHFFLSNARQWLDEFHFDGLRLDAVHAILDTSAKPFLEELSRLKKEVEQKRGIPLHLIAESDANNPRLLTDYEQGGLALDGHWADDLHHVVHTLLTGESDGYYADYGKLEQLAEIYREGVLFHGGWSPSRHRHHGRSYEGIDRSKLMVCAQNHDQIGNRMNGDRLVSLTDLARAKLAAACVLLSPGMPLLFMGEEWAETAPFLYFVDHTDPVLLEAVRKGRAEEFKDFRWSGEVPDPAAESTFLKSKLNWSGVQKPEGKDFFKAYQRLIGLSKWIRQKRLFEDGRVATHVETDQKLVSIEGRDLTGDNYVRLYFSFSTQPNRVVVAPREGGLEIAFNSSDNGARSEGQGIFKQGEIEIPPFTAIALRSPSSGGL